MEVAAGAACIGFVLGCIFMAILITLSAKGNK